jgi:D-tyrosyl-tRNA(Tyr) deacylase
MKIILQRVSAAQVSIDAEVIARIDRGYLLLVGISPTDTEEAVKKMAEKVRYLRVFADTGGKINLDIVEVGGSVLAVSQFTLYADVSGRRPGFSGAARPEVAAPLFELFVTALRELGLHVETGRFGADMQVSLVNDGPLTLALSA